MSKVHFQTPGGIWIPVSAANPLPTTGGGGGGSGDASEATLQDILAELELKADLSETQPTVDGAAGTLLTEGNTVRGGVNDAAVVGDTASGTIIARLRGLGKQWADAVSGVSPLFVNFLRLDKVNDEIAAARPQCTLYQGTRSASGEASVIAAPSAGNHLEIWRLSAQAWEDGPQTVSWREGTGGTDKYSWKLVLDGDGVSLALNGSWHLPTETALWVNTTSDDDTRLLVEYRVVADSDRA